MVSNQSGNITGHTQQKRKETIMREDLIKKGLYGEEGITDCRSAVSKSRYERSHDRSINQSDAV